MRHRRAASRLSRHPAHRVAMLRNMALNLFEHGRIRTTIQKAKAAKPLIEKVITLGKKGSLHHRLLAISALGSTTAAKAAVRKVFSEIKDRFANRNGGYTRILKLPPTIRQIKSDLPRGKAKRANIYGSRLGDNAKMVLLELCEAEIVKKERVRKKRRALKKKAPAEQAPEATQAAAQA